MTELQTGPPDASLVRSRLGASSLPYDSDLRTFTLCGLSEPVGVLVPSVGGASLPLPASASRCEYAPSPRCGFGHITP